VKIGDLVTYRQRADLQKFPCPWRRMGLILGKGEYSTKSGKRIARWKVYWFGSQNKTVWEARELEIAR
jgi:hypothetical protein